MLLRSLTSQAVGAIGALCACVACANDSPRSEESTASANQAILGGTPADQAEYNAVGALLIEQPWGLDPVCSGTLIGRKAVLTAKHCTEVVAGVQASGAKAYFGFGTDMLAPEQVIAITNFVAAPPSPTSPGLMQNGGRDVAVAYLESAPKRIKPAKVAKFNERMNGSQFEIAGFGVSESWGMYGLRYTGLATARATSGAWYSLLFNGDKQAYTDWYWTDAPYAEPSDEQAEQWWTDYQLEPGYELLAGGLPGEAVGCHGDSGGPLFRFSRAGKLTVYGVSFAVEDSIANYCALGGAYLVLNKEMLNFVKSAVDDCEE